MIINPQEFNRINILTGDFNFNCKILNSIKASASNLNFISYRNPNDYNFDINIKSKVELLTLSR